VLYVTGWARGNGSWNYVEFMVRSFYAALFGCGIFGSVHMWGKPGGEGYREKEAKVVAFSRYSSLWHIQHTIHYGIMPIRTCQLKAISYLNRLFL
jgi:hypothetical protein